VGPEPAGEGVLYPVVEVLQVPGRLLVQRHLEAQPDPLGPGTGEVQPVPVGTLGPRNGGVQEGQQAPEPFGRVGLRVKVDACLHPPVHGVGLGEPHRAQPSFQKHGVQADLDLPVVQGGEERGGVLRRRGGGDGEPLPGQVSGPDRLQVPAESGLVPQPLLQGKGGQDRHRLPCRQQFLVQG